MAAAAASFGFLRSRRVGAALRSLRRGAADGMSTTLGERVRERVSESAYVCESVRASTWEWEREREAKSRGESKMKNGKDKLNGALKKKKIAVKDN